MIVIQGKSVLEKGGGGAGGAGGTFTITLDNEHPTIESTENEVMTDTTVDRNSKMIKFDGSDIDKQMVITVDGTIEGVENPILSEVVAKGRGYKIKPPSIDMAGLPKEQYLKEMVAFQTAQVDLVLGTAKFNSDFLAVTITCDCEIAEIEQDVSDAAKMKVTSPTTVQFTYDGNKIIRAAMGSNDFIIIDSIEAKVTGTLTETGEVAESSLNYENANGYPIVNAVAGLSSSAKNFTTFDLGMHMSSGWLDGMDIPYQIRSLISTEATMFYALFKYLYFAAASPTYFNKSVDKIALCGTQEGGLYKMPYVVTNNASFNGTPIQVSATARGPELDGMPTVSASQDTLYFDTSGASTATGRILVDVLVAESPFSVHTFEAPAGIGSGEFVTSGVDCKVSLNTIDNMGSRGRVQQASAGNLQSFHHMINGFENMLGVADFGAMILMMALAIITRGIACVGYSNTLAFVFYLMYEREKFILSGAERNIMLGGIKAVLNRHNVNMAGAGTSVPKNLRKEMSKQYLATIQQDMFRSHQSVSGYGGFTWIFMCIPLNFVFPRYLPWLPTASDVGVPLEVNILENADKPNGIITDDHVAMMKKNLGFYIFESRVDWILSPMSKSGIKDNATFWMQMGSTVVLKRDGRHQEMYAVEDDGYRIGDWQAGEHNADYVSIPGEIGDLWNEWKESVLASTTRFARLNTLSGPTGASAQAWVEDTTKDIRFMMIWNDFEVLDIDNETHISRGKTQNVKFLRPNKDVIIALKA